MLNGNCTSLINRFAPIHQSLCASAIFALALDNSDVDLLFSSDVRGLKFYGMVEKLRTTLHKKVDVLSLEQLKDNLELTDEILKNGIRIYG